MPAAALMSHIDAWQMVVVRDAAWVQTMNRIRSMIAEATSGADAEETVNLSLSQHPETKTSNF